MTKSLPSGAFTGLKYLSTKYCTTGFWVPTGSGNRGSLVRFSLAVSLKSAGNGLGRSGKTPGKIGSVESGAGTSSGGGVGGVTASVAFRALWVHADGPRTI